MSSFIPPEEYYKTIPKKFMGAGVIFVDSHDRVLVLETTYKERWEVPGGIIDQEESPLDAAVREVKEELGIDVDRTLLKLTTIDFQHTQGVKPDNIQFHFWGGVIDPTAIVLDSDELKSFKFIDPSELEVYCKPALARRTLATLQAAKEGKMVYLEDGYPIV